MHLPSITPGLVEYTFRDSPRAGMWYGPFTWKQWVMDWRQYPGSLEELIELDGTRRTVERPPQSWFIFPPGAGYRHYDSVQHPPWLARWLFFELDGAFEPLQGRTVKVLVDPEERISAHVRALHAISQHREPGAEIAERGHAIAILGEIAMAARRGHAGTPEDPWPVRSPAAARAPGEHLLQRIEQLVMRRFDRPPSLGDLAAALHLSSSALSHRFQRETGMSVMERVRWLRVREARRLLADPEATVAAVARTLGFSSPFHLSRVFSQVTGMSPREFRRRSRAADSG